MRILAAPDKFRGTLTGPEAAAAIAVAAHGHDCVRLPLADGGEGTLDALGGGNRALTVTGPLGAPVTAAWRLDGAAAFVEAAQACGLLLAGGAERNDPMDATTRGVGELLVAALRAGARRIVLGVGGSATTDGGAGAVAVLDELGLDAGAVEVCCDVRTPFTRAAEVFGPQKGASPEQIRELTERLRRLRADVRAEHGLDLDALPGSGAAGGLAGGLAARGARLVAGFDAVADHVGLDAALRAADLVVTGEGRLDATSLDGKVVGGVLRRAAAAGVRAVVVCGAAEVDPGVPMLDLTETFGHERALGEPAECLREGLPRLLSRL